MRRWFSRKVGNDFHEEERPIEEVKGGGETRELQENAGSGETSTIDEVGLKCPKCGAELEQDAKFCTQCATPLTREAEARSAGIEPWALRAGEKISNLPGRIKYGIPVLIIFIAGALIALFVIASGHTPRSAVERYLSQLKFGDYGRAYDMLVHSGEVFSSPHYFEEWQKVQTKELGRLKDFKVYPGESRSRFFGRLLEEKEKDGTPFTATLIFSNRSFDIRLEAKDAGGFWPLKRYRILLSKEPVRIHVWPVGARVKVDGLYIGRAEADEDLEKALSLSELPEGLSEVPDYAKKIFTSMKFLVDEAKNLIRALSRITVGAQQVIDRFGARKGSWSEVMDAFDSTVSQSKEFSREVARFATYLYWIFGGGDDGSIRAKLSRSDPGIDLSGLPEGYHIVEAEYPGCNWGQIDFLAPSDVEITLVPNKGTREKLKGALGSYFAAKGQASISGNPALLANFSAGKLLDQAYSEIEKKLAQGYLVASDLLSVKYSKFKILSGDYALVDTEEIWNFTTIHSGVPVSVVPNVKKEVTYTLELRGDTWIPIEQKLK